MASTIKQVIEDGKTAPFSANTLHFKKIITNTSSDNFIILMNPIFDKYYELLKNYISEVNLTDEEYNKYIYKPKLLSLDIYGTTELYFLLLKINNMTSIIDFNKQNIKVFKKEIMTILNEIMIHEEDEYINNELEIINTING